MVLFASVVALAFILGFAFGGRLSGFEGIRLRWWGLAIVGLVAQLVPLPEGAGGTDFVVRSFVLSTSYSLLLLFAALNVRAPGMAVILIGLALNFTVIATNGGMPVSAEALRDAGRLGALERLQTAGAGKHHLQTDEDVLMPLADVIPIPPPIAQAISIGDVLVYAGLIWLVVAAMRGRIPQESPPTPGEYLGKHRLGSELPPPPRPDLDPMPRSAATTWGTGR